jgi:multisubunit Na+/H+ antiporter MnhF subunit
MEPLLFFREFLAIPAIVILVACLIMLAFVCLIALISIIVGTAYFFEAILVLSIAGFLVTVMLAKFIERGRIFDE